MKRMSLIATLSPIMLAACGAGTSQLQSLGDHTPKVTQGATVTGVINPEQRLDLRIALPLRDEATLDNFLEALYDPQSTSYGAYLTPDEFSARYAPDANMVAEVRASLVANGFEVDDEAHGTLLGARVSAADAEAFFHTQIATYEGADGNTFFAPNTDIAIGENLPIAGVYGLHTSFPLKSNVRMGDVMQNKALVGNLSAAAVRKAYNVAPGADGKGQIIALYELDNYIASDITAYAQANGIPAAPLKNINVDGGTGLGSGQGEVTLDIQLANALSPNVAQIRVYIAANGGQSALDEWNEIANPTLDDKQLVSIVSSSWGLAENQAGNTEIQREGVFFKQMAAQGQSVFIASGDSGDKADGSNISVSDPASQLWAVAVGGTTLSSTGGAYVSETAWSGSGGGISAVWPIPTWQKSAIAGDAQASTTKRNVPDIALDADPSTGYQYIVNGKAGVVGGTSCAAPIWAAFFAQVNQARAAKALPPMGFVAPALYLVAGNAQAYAANFHDTKSGNNGSFSAVAGYDNVTGLGSFNAATLLQTLSNSYGRSIFPAPTVFTPTP